MGMPLSHLKRFILILMCRYVTFITKQSFNLSVLISLKIFTKMPIKTLISKLILSLPPLKCLSKMEFLWNKGNNGNKGKKSSVLFLLINSLFNWFLKFKKFVIIDSIKCRKNPKSNRIQKMFKYLRWIYILFSNKYFLKLLSGFSSDLNQHKLWMVKIFVNLSTKSWRVL